VFKGLNQATTSSFHVRPTSLFTIIQTFDAESMNQTLRHIDRLTGNCLPVYRVWLFTSHSSVCMLLLAQTCILTKYEKLCAGFIDSVQEQTMCLPERENELSKSVKYAHFLD